LRQPEDHSISREAWKKKAFFVFGILSPAFFVYFSGPCGQRGIFSFFGNLFGTIVDSETVYADLQKASLLQATVGTSLSSSIGGGDIGIANNSTLLPGIGSLDAGDTKESTQKSGQISIYVVREGDSLSQIAKMFGVSANTIRWANDIGKNDVINVGQTLTILPVSGVEYTVKSGDTIESIAKKFDGDAMEILQFNSIADEKSLVAGSLVIIPGGEMAKPVLSGSSSSVTASASHPALFSATSPSYDGYYIRPISGGRKTQGIHGYNAVDLAAPAGTPILASASGEVIISKEGGWNGGYGNYIVIEHPNKTQTLYSHLSGTVVKRGWNVGQGHVIGYVGSTGRSTGPHLHFEIRGAANPF